MQFEYKLNRDKKNVIVKMSGEFDLDEYSIFYKELMTEMKGKGIISMLWDARKLDVRNVSTSHIEKLIIIFKKWSSFREGGKTAWVVDDSFSFGMSRMFENMAGVKDLYPQGFSIKITMNYEEAEEWICG